MKIVVLLSGGLDSIVSMYIAASNFPRAQIYPLFVSYGQKNLSNERKSAEAALARLQERSGSRIRDLRIVDLFGLGGSSLLNSSGMEIPKDRKAADTLTVGSTYVPARNLILLALAGSYCEEVKGHAIYIGLSGQGAENQIGWKLRKGKVSKLYPAGYPDCNLSFVRLFEAALIDCSPNTKPRISVPVLHMAKSQILRRGLELGVDVLSTWSCYENGDSPCLRCDACAAREKGLRLVDFTRD